MFKKPFFKLNLISLVMASTLGANLYAENNTISDVPCSDNSASCQQVWTMSSSDKSLRYNDHGRAFISCNSSRDIAWNDANTLTVKYHHQQGVKGGQVENTCYVQFSNIFNNQAIKQHGYVTADIIVNGDPAIKDQIWPAFWLVGPSWPTNGEIDQAEYMANNVTNNNLNGGEVGHNVSKTVAHYNQLGLGDINQQHTYGIEWQLKGDIKDPNHTYILTTYFDGEAVGQPYTLSTSEYPDKAVIQGLNQGNMSLTFDTENIAALGDSVEKVRNSKTLDYSLTASNVKAYAINGSSGNDCPAPDNLNGQYNSGSSQAKVNISWQKPSGIGASQVQSFQIYDYHKENPKLLGEIPMTDQPLFSEIVGQPGPDGNYVFQLASKCNDGKESKLIPVTIHTSFESA